MKRKFFFVFVSAMATSTLFMSCQKDLKPSKDTVLRSTPLPTTGTYCRIETMDVSDSWDPAPYGLSFHYDEFENPIAVEPSHPIMFVRPARYFHYDHWHRLREYQVYAGSSGPVRIYNEWHLYGYDLNGRIGEDTAYFDATSVENLATHTYGGISHLEYDTQGRIIRETVRDLQTGIPSIHTYAYNAQGNSISNGSPAYDDKLSILRTNDIWMFLMRDYSINNPYIADGYNSTGYPTIFNSLNVWLRSGFDHSVVNYGCRQSHYF